MSKISNKWQKRIEKSNPEFYEEIINLMPRVPDLRPEFATKHMNKENWDPWHRLYDELSALGFDNNDAKRHLEVMELLMGQKKWKYLNWSSMIDESIREFVITYPVLTYLIERISDPINLEGMWVALDKFDKLKNPRNKVTTLAVFAGDDDTIREKLLSLYPKGWAWGKHRKTTWFGFLPANILMHLNYGGQSYISGRGFALDDLMVHLDLNVDFVPPYWHEEDEEDIFTVNFKLLTKIATSTTLPHREIICKRIGKHYGKYPKKEWYNKTNKTFLPVSSRQWIIVNEPYKVVSLDSAIKDKPLTIEDIFFACRALCTDETYTYERFSVMEDKKGILMLSVQ